MVARGRTITSNHYIFISNGEYKNYKINILNMKEVINLNADEFENRVLKSEVPVLVDFWAPWCAPCRAMAPILDKLALSSDPDFHIAKVDVENKGNNELAMHYEIRSIPNMKLFKGGIVVHEFVGVVDAATLESAVKRALQS